MIRGLAALAVVLIAIGLSSSVAAADLVFTPPEAPPAPSPGPVLMRLFGMTFFVLLLCAGLIWFIRLAQRPRVSAAGDPGRLKHLESASLNGRCSVHLVQAGKSRVFVAVDASGLKACHLIEENFDQLVALARQPAPPLNPEPEKKQTIDEILRLLAAARPAA